jgi:hypothetical protein
MFIPMAYDRRKTVNDISHAANIVNDVAITITWRRDIVLCHIITQSLIIVSQSLAQTAHDTKQSK